MWFMMANGRKTALNRFSVVQYISNLPNISLKYIVRIGKHQEIMGQTL